MFRVGASDDTKLKHPGRGSNLDDDDQDLATREQVNFLLRRGDTRHRGGILASHPAAPGSVPSVSKKIQMKNEQFC